MSIAVKSLKKLVGAAMVAVVLTAGNAFSQLDDANIPFVVNVDATVTLSRGSEVITMSVDGGVETAATIEAGKIVSIRQGSASRLANTVHLRVDSRGNVNLNLPQSNYHNATVSLYSLNGRRIMHTNINETTRNFSRTNIATGVYMLSVKGVNGNSFTSRLNHRGGTMNVNVSYGAVSNSNFRRDAVALAPDPLPASPINEWDVTISAAGYHDSVFTLTIVHGDNPKQEITLWRKLAENTWTDGLIPLDGTREEWFRFSATSDTHYIHFRTDNYLYDSFRDVSVQLFNNNFDSLGSPFRIGRGDLYKTVAVIDIPTMFNITNFVTAGQTYYIRVTPWDLNRSGAYQIALNTSTMSPMSPCVAGFNCPDDIGTCIFENEFGEVTDCIDNVTRSSCSEPWPSRFEYGFVCVLN